MIRKKIIAGILFYSTVFSVFAGESDKEILKTLNNPVSTSSILQVIVGLVVVLAVIAVSAFVLKRMGRFSSLDNGVLKVVATLTMGTRDRIVLLQAGEQQIVVGISPGRMQTLCQLEKPVEIDDADVKSSGSFSEKLVSAMKSRSDSRDHK